jgi:hypothetical protein
MTSTNLRRREYFLSLWAQDRLGERKTVEWATTALKQIRGDLVREALINAAMRLFAA